MAKAIEARCKIAECPDGGTIIQTPHPKPEPRLLFCKFFKRPDCIVDGVASSGKVGWLYGRGRGQLFRAFDEASEGSACGAAGPAWGSGSARVRPLWVGRCAGLACLGAEAVG